LANHLPIDGEQVARAAEEMIAQHGDSALVEADKQIKTRESEGFDAVAETWKLIREAIRDTQQLDATKEGYQMALKKGVFMSE
jgi:acyl-CoA reductase-like NAD-dependent aldehyde dehydrogenase